MRLQSLDLNNFRQFYGLQVIEFAQGGEKNITVFHGYNGSGKTALLNAFIWCLYGETTPDLEVGDKLENERAVAEAGIGDEIEVAVDLSFNLREDSYRVRRSRKSSKESPESLRLQGQELHLWKIGPSGELEEVGANDKARQHRIEQVLPRQLYPFFFFNGERVERLASPDAYDSVESGVKTLLDIKIYERSMEHLRGAVSRSIAGELKGFGDTGLKEKLDELQRIEAEIAEKRGGLEQYQANQKALECEIAEIEAQQGQIGEIEELVRSRAGLRQRDGDLLDQIAGARQQIAGVISKNGYLAFADQTLQKMRSAVLDARKRGELPGKIKPQFVDDLLERASCICGRPLEAGTEEAGKLLEWREATGLAELEERISYTSAFVTQLQERRGELRENLARDQGTLAELLSNKRKLREELAIVDEEIDGRGDIPDVARLQDRRREAGREKEREAANVIVCREKLAELEQRHEAINGELRQIELQDERAKTLQAQLGSIEAVARAFEEIAAIQKNDVRQALDAQIREIWADAAIKDYRACVTEDYRLLLTKTVDGRTQPVHGASTGEKQVLALSFVGSLVHKAAENAGMSHGIEVGGHYPLVMDSAFGALEDDYRLKVAEWLPSLANQVIVMASKTQWRVEVEGAMRPRIGREYILELHTPKPSGNRTIEIMGSTYDYVVHADDPTEQTLIKKV